MKLKTILITLGILLFLFLAFRVCTAYVGKKIKGSTKELVKGRQTEFLEGIDFSDGNYALILDDEEPALLVDDVAVLQANKDKIKLSISWMSYLPGEGRAPYGLLFYKGNTLIDAKLARKFSTFNIGAIREHGRPLAYKSIYEPKAAYERKKDSLEKNDKIYISRITETNPNGFEYRFTLSCPSILVVENDSTFNKHTFGLAFAERIAKSLSQYSGFKAGTDASNSKEPSPLLVLKKDGATQYLHNSDTNKTIPLDGYELHGNSLFFSCTKEFYEQIQSHDFSESFIRQGLSEEDIKALIREKIGLDTKEVQLDAVYASMFENDFKIGGLHERKYELRYYELISKTP